MLVLLWPILGRFSLLAGQFFIDFRAIILLTDWVYVLIFHFINWLSLCINFSFYLYSCLYALSYVFAFSCLCLYVCHCTIVSLCLSLCVCHCVFVTVFLSLYHYQFAFVTVCLSLSVCHCLSLSLCQCVFVTVCVNFCLALCILLLSFCHCLFVTLCLSLADSTLIFAMNIYRYFRCTLYMMYDVSFLVSCFQCIQNFFVSVDLLSLSSNFRSFDPEMSLFP